VGKFCGGENDFRKGQKNATGKDLLPKKTIPIQVGKTILLLGSFKTLRKESWVQRREGMCHIA